MDLQHKETTPRVALFARVDTALNPYILLYKEALERQGFTIRLERKFSLKWLITSGKSCDIIHLHWMEAAYKPAQIHVRSDLVKRLLENRIGTSLRGILRLAGFSAALVLAKLQRKMVVYTVHNLVYRGEFRTFTLLNRVAHYVVMSLADHIHVHSLYARRVLHTYYKRKDGVMVVPLGNYVGYYPNQISRREARRQLGLPDDAFVYLFLGLLRPYKGVGDLISAFRKLESPTAQLLIVGSPSSASYKEEIMCLSGDGPRIRLIPEFVPDEALQLYINACNVCVLPYKNVTTSAAAVLALSFGRPVIAPAVASFPELITPETGVLYDSSQPDALVSALREAAQRSWSEAKILDYAHQFDWDTLGPRLAALYRSGR